jgi:hypothetical protein
MLPIDAGRPAPADPRRVLERGFASLHAGDAAAAASAAQGVLAGAPDHHGALEKMAALRTKAYFRERAARADLAEFDRILAKAGGEPPRVGDELPTEETTP